MQSETLDARVQTLTELVEKHLGLRTPSLHELRRRGVRHLPRHLRPKLDLLVEAETMAAHPKLMRRIDDTAVDRAFEDIAAYVRTQDFAEARKTRALRTLAGLTLKLLVFAALLIAFLRWRGLI